MPGAAQHKPPTDFRLQAAIWTLIGALFFALMNSVAKYLGLMDGPHDGVDRSVPVLQVTFARYAVAALIVLPFVAMQPDRFQMSAPFRYVVRTGAGFGGIAFMFLAVSLIPLAAATAIGFTSPIFAMLIAALMLSEKVTFRQWIGAVIGLAGAVIIAAPGESFVAVGALVALAAAAFMGAEVVGVRWLAKTEDHPVTILFFSNLFGAVLSGVVMLPFFVWPTMGQLRLLILVGLLAILGQFCILRAARKSDASFIAPFFYVSLFYAAVIGLFVFNEIPSRSTMIGCFAILGSAILLVRQRGR